MRLWIVESYPRAFVIVDYPPLPHNREPAITIFRSYDTQRSLSRVDLSRIAPAIFLLLLIYTVALAQDVRRFHRGI